MKTLFIAAATAAATLAMPAQAQTAPGATFSVGGTVAAACSYTGGTITFPTILTDGSGVLTANQSATSTGQAFYCNGAGTTVDVGHVALANSVAAADGFTSSLNFTPVIAVDGTELASGDGNGKAAGAKTGSLTVTASKLTATAKPMAGTYSGSISITFKPLI